LARNTEPVAIIGLGRFGSTLALELADSGVEVLAIDNDMDKVQRVSGRLAHTVRADCTDPDALRDIGVADFMRAVVAIGTDQESSILATSILSEFGVDDIWSKAVNDQHARILRRVGAHHVVQPEQDMGQRVAHLLSGGVLDYFEIDRGYVVARCAVPRAVAGERLSESDIPRRFKVQLVGVRLEHSTEFTQPDPKTLLTYGAELLVAGAPADVDAFSAAQ
jgi:trk system potassium uptake protein TrkA